MEGVGDVAPPYDHAQGRLTRKDGTMFDDDDDETADETLVTEADVTCPHCGEGATIIVDPGGGGEQDYVEDCPVCCRPWLVHVRWDEEGAVQAWLDAADE